MLLQILLFFLLPFQEQPSFENLYSKAKSHKSDQQAIEITNLAIAEAKSNYDLANSFYLKAFHFSNLRKYDSSMVSYYRAISLYSKIEDQKHLSDCYNNLGIILKIGGFYSEGVKMLKKSLSYKLKHENGTIKHGHVLFQIARQFRELDMIDSAYLYYDKSIEIFSSNNDFGKVAAAQLDIGIIYAQKLDDYYEARKYYNYALGNYTTNTKKANCLNNIASSYDLESKYDTAIVVFKQALKHYSESNKSDLRTANCLLNIGRVYGKLNQFDSANFYFCKARQFNVELDKESLIELIEIYKTAEIESEVKKGYAELFVITKNESIRSKFIEKENLKLQFQMAFQKIQTEKEQEKHAEERVQLIVFSLIAIFLMILGIVVYLMFMKMQRRKIKDEILADTRALESQVAHILGE